MLRDAPNFPLDSRQCDAAHDHSHKIAPIFTVMAVAREIISAIVPTRAAQAKSWADEMAVEFASYVRPDNPQQRYEEEYLDEVSHLAQKWAALIADDEAPVHTAALRQSIDRANGTGVITELVGALENILRGIETGAITSEQDETLANAVRRARAALSRAGEAA